jgi:hypothetical protein
MLNEIKAIWHALSIRQRIWMGVISLLLVVGGCCGGRFIRPRLVTRTVVQVQTQFQDREVVKTVTVEKPVIKWKTQTITRTIYAPGTQTPTEVIVTHQDSGSQRGDVTTTTDASRVDTGSSSSKTDVSVSSGKEGTLHAFVGIGLRPLRDTSPVVAAGIDARVLGPFTLGGAVVLPTSDMQSTAVLVTAGYRW